MNSVNRENKYRYSNFEVGVDKRKSLSVGVRFNKQTYLRVELREPDFGIYNVDLCFSDKESTIKFLKKTLEMVENL